MTSAQSHSLQGNLGNTAALPENDLAELGVGWFHCKGRGRSRSWEQLTSYTAGEGSVMYRHVA